MEILHSKELPEICRYADIDVGGTFMPINANEGNWIFMAINEVIEPGHDKPIINAVCLDNGALYSFEQSAKVIAVNGTLSIERYNVNNLALSI